MSPVQFDCPGLFYNSPQCLQMVTLAPSGDAMQAGSVERPRLVQGGDAPLFRSRAGEVNLVCQCGRTLVEGFLPRRLIALDLQCSGCGFVTTTPEWPAGEPLPLSLASIGRTGHFFIGGSVDLDQGPGSLTCDQEIERVARLAGITAPGSSSLDLTEEGLQSLERRFSEWWPDFHRAMRRTRTAFDRGNLTFLDFPPAWAMLQLRRSSLQGHIDATGADGVAIGYLQVLLHVCERWQHHPGFPEVRRAMLTDFRHNVTQMLAASYLADAGNWIGLGEPLAGGGRSSDLYVNLDSVTRHAVEVKAPNEFWWPNGPGSPDRIGRVIESKFRESRGQINAVGGGILVIGAGSASADFIEVAQRVAEELNAAGRVPTRIAGVVIVGMEPMPSVQWGNTGIGITMRARVSSTVNSRYAGPGGLRVGAG